MAKSTEDQFAERVSALVVVALELTDRKATRVTVDLQQSGECPYRIEIPDEILPLAGVATVDSGRWDQGDLKTSVAASGTGE